MRRDAAFLAAGTAFGLLAAAAGTHIRDRVTPPAPEVRAGPPAALSEALPSPRDDRPPAVIISRERPRNYCQAVARRRLEEGDNALVVERESDTVIRYQGIQGAVPMLRCRDDGDPAFEVRLESDLPQGAEGTALETFAAYSARILERDWRGYIADAARTCLRADDLRTSGIAKVAIGIGSAQKQVWCSGNAGSEPTRFGFYLHFPRYGELKDAR